MPVNYQDGKIYTITNTLNNTVYVGSTAQPRLSSRMTQHRATANDLAKSTPLHVAMRLIGPQNFRIVLHHAFPCNSRDELEGEEYRVLTQFIASGTPHYNFKVNATGWKITDATKQKLSKAALRLGKVGSDSNVFSFGSVYYDGAARNNDWTFQWFEQPCGEKKRKKFAVGKYGYYGAHFRAEEFRKSVYPEYGTLEDIACDDLGHIEWEI